MPEMYFNDDAVAMPMIEHIASSKFFWNVLKYPIGTCHSSYPFFLNSSISDSVASKGSNSFAKNLFPIPTQNFSGESFLSSTTH